MHKKYDALVGGYKSRLYTIWQNMKQRCGNPKAHEYSAYGGRGIQVCDEWVTDFAAFRDWALANGYADDLTIDRIDNDKGYSPENCRWIPQSEQYYNTQASKNRAERPKSTCIIQKTVLQCNTGGDKMSSYDGETKRKTTTSTAVKARYNAKVYEQLAFKLPKELVKSFKEKCAAEGVSQAQIIKRAIEDYLNA